MGVIISFFSIEKEQIENVQGVTDPAKVKLMYDNVVEHFDMDKAWEVIHFMITGEKAYYGDHAFSKLLSPPSSTFKITEAESQYYWEEAGNRSEEAIKKWQEIDNKMSSLVRYLTTDDIRKLVEIINQNDIDDLIAKTKFSSLSEKGIYPEIWEDSNEHKEYVKMHYQALSEFLNRTLENEQYIIVS